MSPAPVTKLAFIATFPSSMFDACAACGEPFIDDEPIEIEALALLAFHRSCGPSALMAAAMAEYLNCERQ